MIRISAAQMSISDKSLDVNAQKIQDYMSLARGSDIICFPETSLSGLIRPEYGKVEGLIKKIGERSRLLQMWSVFGSYAQRGNQTFNEVYVLNREGKLIHTYQKKHLWNEKGITPGTTNRVVGTDFGDVGVINCWDIAFAEEARTLARNGAKIIFCPSYWFDKPGPGKTDYFGYPEARAHENQVYLIFCDAYSEKDTLGRSRILSPVRVLAKADGKEEMISANIDLEKLDSLREKYDCYPKLVS